MSESKKEPVFKDLNNLLDDDKKLVSGDRLETTLEILGKIKQVWIEINDEKLRIKRKFEEFNLNKEEINQQFQENKTKLSKLINNAEEELRKFSKLENKVILLLDYWNRESEILSLQKKMNEQITSTERQEILKRLDQLVLANAGLEKGLKERNISPETVRELRKKMGIWEEANDKNK